MNKIFIKLFLCLLWAGVCLVACDRTAQNTPLPSDTILPADTPLPTSPAQVKSNQERVLKPAVPANTLQTLVNGNNIFALDLYQALRIGEGNLLYSPYSISLAFAMTYAGARGQTETQMAQTLHYDLPQNEFHPAFNQLDLMLMQKSDAEEQPTQLDIANAVWAQQDYAFLPEYLDILALNYGAGIYLSDFTTQAEETTDEINQWVSNQTHERIQDILEPGELGPLTRMVLVNAIFFKADWQNHFDADDTRKAFFYLLDRSDVQVDMMSTYLYVPYLRGESYQAVRLPYADKTLVMEIIVPDPGQFEAFEAALDWPMLQTILNGMHRADLHLRMPKFTFSSRLDLADTLGAMGMLDAFTPQEANFSGMDGKQVLSIDSVIHQAFIAVDETGTEAAASTVIEIEATTEAFESEIIVLTIDRPFIFIIRDLSSGQILFIGRVLDPT